MKEKNNQDNAVVVENLSKYFSRGHKGKRSLKEYFVNPFGKIAQEKFLAVDGVSFAIKQGEFFGIIGRNGSGKSTLLKMLAGIYKPDSGEIKINGRMVPFLELGVGFNPDLTARENIYLNGTILGMTIEEIKGKFDEIVSFAEIEKFVDTPVKNFSSGMYVRLAFAIAIQAKAEIYLIDEILAVGDFAFQQKCFALFRELKKSGKTFIFVSHDLGSIREFCDRVVYIKDGRVQKIAKAEEVINQYIINDRRESGTAIAENKLGRDTKQGGSLKISVIDEKGDLVIATVSRKDIIIKIEYELDKKVLDDELVFGIGIYKDGNFFVYGTNTLIEQKKIKYCEKGAVKFIVKNFPMQRGHYGISAAIHNKENFHYVWKDNGYEFDIIASNARHGLLDLDIEIESFK
jgi:lipopolysaccharide transport system ATP-binding protein